jgi:hypothetical protein
VVTIERVDDSKEAEESATETPKNVTITP